MSEFAAIGLSTWVGDDPGVLTLPETVIYAEPPAAAHHQLLGVVAGLGCAAAVITLVTFGQSQRKGAK